MNHENHSSSLDLLALQDQEVVKNTFYRYPKVSPHITLYEDHLEVKTIDESVDLYKLDEVVLYILSTYKWIPLWLIQQWFEDYHKDGFLYASKWIKVGLVWAETTALGVFIRPTKYLLDLMIDEPDKTKEERKKSWVDINFNLINHTCAEEQAMFDIMMGNPKSELWMAMQMAGIKLLPCYHPLHIKAPGEQGTIIIPETEFGVNVFDKTALENSLDKLKSSINSSNAWSEEFKDYSLFPIITYNKDDKIVTQRPDLVIPIPRISGNPQSCSIELELTAKTKEKYDVIMYNYRNNLTFGCLFYLCATNGIANLVRKAYINIGGLGTCRLFIVPYVAPAQKIYDVKQDELATKQIVKLTVDNTKKEGI